MNDQCPNDNLDDADYIDEKGRALFISQGIGNSEWGTFYRKPSGSLARVKSILLPMRPTYEQAELDLHEQAKRKRWKKYK